jgi:hypothetical protein
MRNGILSVLLVTVWIACAVAAPANKTLTGNWGGPHIGLEILGETARIEYDCAQGTIDGPIVLDRAGRFEAAGTHTLDIAEHGGPVHQGEEPKPRPARYKGRLKGKILTLTVTLTDSGENAGTFTLTLGATPRLVKCL